MSDSSDGDRFEISYGKRAVPIYRVFGKPLLGITPVPESPFTGRTNILIAAEVDIEVFGKDFLPAYTVGDNALVVATDSMKNIILRQALDYDGPTLEGYLGSLGRHFINTYEHVRDVELQIRELPFPAAIVPDGEGGFTESGVLFEASGRSDRAMARLRMQRAGDGIEVTGHECGRTGLRLMKITGSAFTSFVRDEYTTLPDRRDRPLFIHLDVFWTYRDAHDLLGETASHYVPAEQVRDIVGAVFHEFISESIQHLVHEMGNRLLLRFPQLDTVRFVAQNRTRDPFHVSATDPSVTVYSDPFPAYGEITLRMTRDPAESVPSGGARWEP
jgi:urate oxidase